MKVGCKSITVWDGIHATWPNEAIGWGTTEAPRGALGHWIKIKNGKIDNYQTVVPTTWNGSPRIPRDSVVCGNKP